jgi:hypothetical protein
VPLEPKSATRAEIAERVKSVLETRDLTLYQVCRKAKTLYGHASPYCLPHNLYYGIKLGTYSPTLHQIFALSRITNYRLADWFSIFGFDLEQIPLVQAVFPAKRTVLLDSQLTDPNTWIPWFQDRQHDTPIPPVAPLSQLLETGPPVRQRSLLESSEQRFLYAKVGLEDARAFPDLLPGSIVRIDRRHGASLPDLNRTPSSRLFLVEHGKGLCCCRLLAAGANRILTVSTHLPYAQMEFELYREARILGAVDLEIRSLIGIEQPKVPKKLAKRWTPVPLHRRNASLSQLLGADRLKVDLSLREASSLSGRIARIFDDEHYFMSPSSLSDYEARDTPPHQVQKVIALCIIYAVRFHTFLNTVGLSAAKAGQEPVPDRILSNPPPVRPNIASTGPEELGDRTFLAELLRQSEDVPAFLRSAIADISGLTSPSLRSLFWIGGIKSPLHPYLANGLLVSVDRHRQKPIDSRSRPPWQQNLYIVMTRDGTYLCGPCGLENGTLVMHPDREHMELREQFRNRRDAEVVGHVTTIVRRLP